MIDLLPYLSDDIRDRLLSTVIVLAVLLALRLLSVRVVQARVNDPSLRYKWQKGIGYVTLGLGLLLVGRVWSAGVGQLGTFLGLLTAGVAIALREPLTNFAGWVFILWRRPLRIGDRVQIGEHAGDVIDIGMFQFSILEIHGWVDADQTTGRIVHIPNGRVFTFPQLNYSEAFAFLWAELPVPLSFESNWPKAKAAFLEIAKKHALSSAEIMRAEASMYALGAVDATPRVFTSLGSQGVVLTIRTPVAVRNMRGALQAMAEDVLLAVREWDDVGFAYPTTRFFDQAAEGRPGAASTPWAQGE